MITKTKREIARQIIVHVVLAQILSNFRISVSNALVDDSENFENSIINSLFKTRDIYNLKARLRRENLNSLTSIQTLIRDLNEKN